MQESVYCSTAISTACYIKQCHNEATHMPSTMQSNMHCMAIIAVTIIITVNLQVSVHYISSVNIDCRTIVRTYLPVQTGAYFLESIIFRTSANTRNKEILTLLNLRMFYSHDTSATPFSVVRNCTVFVKVCVLASIKTSENDSLVILVLIYT